MMRHLTGKPDGLLIRWRCAILGHDWYVCDDACCGGVVEWCSRCAVNAYDTSSAHYQEREPQS